MSSRKKQISQAVELYIQYKNAYKAYDEAQEMLQTGEASSFLSQKIKETQDLNEGASEAEALDILVESAQSILSK